QVTQSFTFSTTYKLTGLDEFFDEKKNWGETTVSCGRPWRKEELRLKSNVDLHKLWYILLKERNMLMTMEEEHYRCLERMPSSERFEKVSESFFVFMHSGLSSRNSGTVSDIYYPGTGSHFISYDQAILGDLIWCLFFCDADFLKGS
ncbi:unnamed protein product, partial [Trichobilharzia regenti]